MGCTTCPYAGRLGCHRSTKPYYRYIGASDPLSSSCPRSVQRRSFIINARPYPGTTHHRHQSAAPTGHDETLAPGSTGSHRDGQADAARRPECGSSPPSNDTHGTTRPTGTTRIAKDPPGASTAARQPVLASTPGLPKRMQQSSRS